MVFQGQGSGPVAPTAPIAPFGRVLSCRGSEARVGLPLRVAESDQRATVGRLLAIKSGSNIVLAMIAEVNAQSCSTETADHCAIALVDLLGEIVRDENGGGRFMRGVRCYPAIGEAVEIVGAGDLNLIYASAGSRSIAVGSLDQDQSIPLRVDVDALLAKHFAILGSTGVGKSSGVVVILAEILKARPDVRVLLLDVHNEYARCFGDAAAAIGVHNLRLPFWLFNFEELTDAVYCGKPAVPEELDILAELIPIAKGRYLGYKGGGDRPSIARKTGREFGFTADTPSPYLIQDLINLIDERMGKLENRASRMTHHRLMTRIEAIRNDPRYAFMFENANVGGDTMASVLGQLFRLDAEESAITILSLASLPGEVVDAVVCVSARLAFEFSLWSEGGIPLLLMCEEAHRYASADHSLGFAPTRRALSRIAKEGRKHGVAVGLVTQRPAELDPTIIAQCSTLFVMRMANGDDQAILRSATSEAAANLLAFVPSLATGEVVGIGEAMPVPARFTFTPLPRELLPYSEWRSRLTELPRDLTRAELIRKAIERWRRATTSQARAEETAAKTDNGARAGASALARGLNSLAGDGAPIDPERGAPMRVPRS